MPKSSRVKSPWIWLLLLGFMAIAMFIYRQWFQPPLPGWAAYKAAFLTSDGRVVDNSNHGVSHSESQGYGMLFAFHANDRQSFDEIWHWTKANLQLRQDHLFAWRRLPNEGVTDMNNASDGDMLIAWALLQAGEAWGNDEYLKEGKQILSDLRSTVIRQWQGKTILLPGAYGFDKDGVYILNLSYWLFPAFRDFQRFDPSPDWAALEQSGRYLISQARFGDWQLPPDWLQLGETLQPAADHDPRYGYDAIRVPLNLVWGGINDSTLLQPFSHFYQSMMEHGGHLPPWVDLTNNTMADYDASAGIKAVYGLVAPSLAKDQKLPSKSDDYYSSSLLLMAELAAFHSRVD